MTTAVSSCTFCWCIFNENALVIYYVCSLSLRFSRSMTTTSLHESGTRFLGVRAKWNIVCLGPPPSLPLGLRSRWTVIKQGCAESALRVFCALAFTLFLFMLIRRGLVFLHRRLKPYVCVQTSYATKRCFGGVYIFKLKCFPRRVKESPDTTARKKKRKIKRQWCQVVHSEAASNCSTG